VKQEIIEEKSEIRDENERIKVKPEAENKEKSESRKQATEIKQKKNVGKAKSLDGGSHPEVSIPKLPSMFL